MRLINADELRELYELDGYESYLHVPCEVVLQNIDDMPTIEPKRGEWVEQRDMAELDFKFYTCSQCGELREIDALVDDISNYNFCPNCGADMRSEENGNLKKD